MLVAPIGSRARASYRRHPDHQQQDRRAVRRGWPRKACSSSPRPSPSRSSSAQKPQLVKTKYDYLIADAVLSAGEFELASRQARKKAIDVEQVLTDEFQVKIPAIGAALSKFFSVPYEAVSSRTASSRRSC